MQRGAWAMHGRNGHGDGANKGRPTRGRNIGKSSNHAPGMVDALSGAMNPRAEELKKRTFAFGLRIARSAARCERHGKAESSRISSSERVRG